MRIRHPHADRGNDLYQTPIVAIEALPQREPLPHRLWDPCCGPGNIVNVLRAAGHQVIGSDLVDYGDPTHFYRRDFLMERKAPAGCVGVVMNPPFKLAEEFIAHALELCPLVIALLRLAFFEAGTGRQKKHQLRHYVLDEVPPARVHVFAGRLPMMHRAGWTGRRTNSQTAYAWFVWDRGHAGRTTIDRIHWKSSPLHPGAGNDSRAQFKETVHAARP